MGKGAKKASKSKRAKKADVKDLAVKNATGVKGGGTVSMNDFHFIQKPTASTPL